MGRWSQQINFELIFGGSHDFVRFNFFQLLSISIQLVYSLMIEAHPICGNLDLLTIKLLVVVWMLISQKEKKNIYVLKIQAKLVECSLLV